MNTELERQVLASIIHAEMNNGSNALFNEAKELGVTSDMFLNIFCAEVWAAMDGIQSDGNTIDEVSVQTDLLRKSVDCSEFFSLMDMAQSELHFKQKLNDLIEDYKRRQVSRIARHISEGIEEGMSSEELVSMIESKTKPITEMTPNELTINDMVQNTIDDIFGDPDLGKYLGIGIPQFDAHLWRGGFGPGQLIVVAARPGCGKTAIALNFSQNNCSRGKSVLFFNLEMGHTQMLKRVFSIDSSLPIRHFEGKVASKQQQRTLKDSIDSIRKWKFYIKDNIYNLAQILATARGMHRKHDLDAIIVDYCQLVKPMTRNLPREQQIAEISRELKLLAKDLGVPVILLAQLNRESEKNDREPVMSDLRESGALEQDADAVFFLWQKLEEREDGVPYVRWVLAKQREGVGYASGQFGFLRDVQQMVGYEGNTNNEY